METEIKYPIKKLGNNNKKESLFRSNFENGYHWIDFNKYKKLEYGTHSKNTVAEALDYKIINHKRDTDFLLKIVNALFEYVDELTDPCDRRKKLYSLGSLINENGEPLPIYKNSNASDFTIQIEAILLSLLETSLLDTDDRTHLNWLNFFGLLSYDEKFYYNLFKSDYKENKHVVELLEFLKKYIKTIEVPFLIDSEVIFMSEEVTDDEVFYAMKNFICKTVDTVKNRFNSIINNLVNENLIEIDYKMIAIEYVTDENNQELLYDKNGKAITKKVVLMNEEKQAINDLIIEIKEEYELDFLHGSELFYNNIFKIQFKKRLLEGLTINGVKRYFGSTYRTYSIHKTFTKKEIQKYISKNIKLKNEYNDKKQLYERYKNSRQLHFDKSYNNKLDELNKKLNKSFGDIKINKQIEYHKLMKEVADIQFKNYKYKEIEA